MTAQIPETLIYNGEIAHMTCNPPIPEYDSRIKTLTEVEFNALGEELAALERNAGEIEDLEACMKARPEWERRQGESTVFSTACWRCYKGTWEIKDGRFFLASIVGKYKMLTESPIFADWYSGVLRVPRGKLLHYVHMGYGSVYEEEVHVKIEKGVVVKTKVIDNRGKKFDEDNLAVSSYPGLENHFDGDDDLRSSAESVGELWLG
jgi:hypothetical protein